MPADPAVPRRRVRGAVAAFDRRVDTAFDRIRGNPVADRIFYAASAVGDHGMVWLGLAALRAVRPESMGDDNVRAGLRAAIVLGAESAIVNLGVKSLFRRTRPVFEGDRPHRLRQPLTSSFPSGHASAAMCSAIVLSDGDPFWPVYWVVGAVVAWSRVHVRIHHGSDVVGGLATGLVLGLVARRVAPLG